MLHVKRPCGRLEVRNSLTKCRPTEPHLPRCFQLRKLPGMRMLFQMDHKLSSLSTAEAPGRRTVKHKATPEAQQAAVQAAAAAHAAADFIAKHGLIRPRISFEGDVLRIHAYDMRGRKVSVRERLAQVDQGRGYAQVAVARNKGVAARPANLATRWIKTLSGTWPPDDFNEVGAPLDPEGRDAAASIESAPEFPGGAAVRAVPFEQFVQGNRLGHAELAEPHLSAGALSSANAAATDRARRSGHAYLLSLIADGSLLGSADLAQAWGVTPQALRQLADANELVAIKVNNKLRFPIELARFDARSDAQRVSKRLAGLPAIEQVLFMLNEHAELGDKTASEAFRAGQGTKVLALASRVAEVE